MHRLCNRCEGAAGCYQYMSANQLRTLHVLIQTWRKAANDVCGHFLENPTILERKTFTEDGQRNVEDRDLRMDKGELWVEDGEWRMEDSYFDGIVMGN